MFLCYDTGVAMQNPLRASYSVAIHQHALKETVGVGMTSVSWTAVLIKSSKKELYYIKLVSSLRPYNVYVRLTNPVLL